MTTKEILSYNNFLLEYQKSFPQNKILKAYTESKTYLNLFSKIKRQEDISFSNHHYKYAEEDNDYFDLLNIDTFRNNINSGNGRYYSLLMTLISVRDLGKPYIDGVGFIKYVTNKYDAYCKETGSYRDPYFLSDLNTYYSVLINQIPDLKAEQRYYVSLSRDPKVFLMIGNTGCEKGTCFNSSTGVNFHKKLETYTIFSTYYGLISTEEININNIKDYEKTVGRFICIKHENELYIYNKYAKGMKVSNIEHIAVQSLNKSKKVKYTKAPSYIHRNDPIMSIIYTNGDSSKYEIQINDKAD